MMATLNYNRIELTPDIPPGWEHVRIKGSRVSSWQGESAIIMTEHIFVHSFSILITRIFLRSPENLELRLQYTGQGFSFCIEGGWQINDGDGHSLIKKDQYRLFSSSAIIKLIPLVVPGRMSQLLIIRGDSISFPDAAKALKEPLTAPALIMDQVMQLTQTSYLPQPRSFHEKLIRDLINMADVHAASEKLPTEKFTNTELEALYKVSILIEKDLQQHHSIASLAVFSGMNRQKLTTGFKSLFGQTIYTYYFIKRMELAKNLLVYSDLPIKLVSKKAGYRKSTNFSIAFRKLYGITPGQMRRKKPD